MATRRNISFTMAMHGLRAERRRAPAQFVVNGAFDRAAIMKEAARQARMMGFGAFRFSWAQCMAIALRSVWQSAKQAAVTARLVIAA